MAKQAARRDNAPRFPTARGGHVESWFFRANHPTEPRSFWLKATVLIRADCDAIADVWCSLFDGDKTIALKETLTLDAGDFDPEGARIDLDGRIFELHADEGRLEGKLRGDAGAVSWNVAFVRHGSSLGDPLCLLPSRRLIDARFPKNKLLTPAPLARFDGKLGWGRSKWKIDGWWGMQGHNWGAAHSPEYAWGQCVFLDTRGEPFCVAEGASGRLKIGRHTTPLLSMLTVRRAGREYRFDRLVDLWNQRPRIAFPEWSLTMSGPSGTAAIAMRADPERMVCLGYENPDRILGYCLNSKTAAVTLRVNPVDDDAFECTSEFGGALEFLQPQPDPRVGPTC